MNVKINKKLHDELCKLEYKEYIFGSHLHGIATEASDRDFIRVVRDDFYERFSSLAKYYPNIHSFQYDDVDSNSQYVWLTKKQFYHNLFSGDGNMIADVVLLSGEFEDALHLTRTYKIIKAYLGVAKRDLKMHPNCKKKRFHARRSLMMAWALMSGELPKVSTIKLLKILPEKTTRELLDREKRYRVILNSKLDSGLITHYPVMKESDTLAQVMADCNNIREFKY